MKKFLIFILAISLSTFSLFSCRTKDKINTENENLSQTDNENDSESSNGDSLSFESRFESQSENESVSESPFESRESSSIDNIDDNDFSVSAKGRAPVNYGAKPIITQQSEVVSEDSTGAAMGVFNMQGAPVYEGYMIWAFAEFDLTDAETGVNIAEKSISFDLKTVNCGNTLSIIIIDENGNFSNEVPFLLENYGEKDFFSRTTLDNGWTRIGVTLKYVITADYLENASKLLITFSNVDCDRYSNSVFYVDNVRLADGEDFSSVQGYNPSGYYSKEQYTKIIFAGNSFIRTSNVAKWFEIIAESQNANVSVLSISIGNARIEDQIRYAFYDNGYVTDNSPDVIFLQDFYGTVDIINLQNYILLLNEFSSKTEIKIFPGENETEDGKFSSSIYGLDHTDWKGLVKNLKSEKGLTETHLNAIDGWHPNYLSGYVGALLAYMETFGEIPDVDRTVALALDAFTEQSQEYILGYDDSERIELLTMVTQATVDWFNLFDI